MRGVRVSIGAVGVALGLVGGYAFFSQVPANQWLGTTAWLAAGVVAHDALIAPGAVLVGFLVLPRVPPTARAPLRAALIGAAVLVVLTVPLMVTGGLRV